jgi:hypothetical protein
MERNGFSGFTAFLAAAVLLVLASCGGPSMRAYTGPELPVQQTAVVRAGAYAGIVRCDDVKIGPAQNKVSVLPGKHVIEMVMRRQIIGYRFLYSDVIGSAAFVAQAGHRYLADVELVPQDKKLGLIASDYDWAGRVVDEGTGETMAVTTEPLPVKVEYVEPPRGQVILP